MKTQRKMVHIGLAIGILLVLLVLPVFTACSATPTTPTTPTTPATPTTPTPPKTIELTMSNSYPEGDNRFDSRKHWAELVMEDTGDLVSFTYYPGATLVTAKEEFDACAGGISDVSFLIAGMFEAKVPALGSFGCPYAITTIEQARDVFDKVRPILVDVLAPHNLYPAYVSTGSDYILCSSSQIKTLDDFSGKKFRAPSGMMVNFVTDNGGGTVNLPSSEAYMALQRGVIDTSFISVASYNAMHLYEVAPYVTEMNVLGPAAEMTVVNLDTWNSLPKEVQDAMVKRGSDGWNLQLEIIEKQEIEAKATWPELTKGVYELPDAERDHWLSFAPKYLDAYVEKYPETKPIVDILKESAK